MNLEMWIKLAFCIVHTFFMIFHINESLQNVEGIVENGCKLKYAVGAAVVVEVVVSKVLGCLTHWRAHNFSISFSPFNLSSCNIFPTQSLSLSLSLPFESVLLRSPGLLLRMSWCVREFLFSPCTGRAVLLQDTANGDVTCFKQIACSFAANVHYTHLILTLCIISTQRLPSFL